ncbi:hypothetical protein OEIGOIKO_04815 [Streptomyces chrestomyceticus JCM 4735]|uniref:Lipoprotein n=1 Tax=Streptomyces chrestomyceticus JCM 4735 TaxID=1306181 RepID=A0A7U9KYD5_9ACTN|nr:hypothetical protein [Streptomyces chrestomyceticus]GCD37033.1 hypothetical protein OEIGOIKO_04815 [Streptomyces chrestomyceticus JCM 4735]
MPNFPGPVPRLRAAALATAGAALVALTTGACGGPSDCCVKAPTASPSPTAPDGVRAFPSQATSLRVRTGTDFDIVLRAGGSSGPGAGVAENSGWRVDEPKIEGAAVRHRTGLPASHAGVRAAFHAVSPGTARIVLTSADRERTMTYQVTVGTGPATAPSAAPSATHGGLNRGRSLSTGFAAGSGGEVTVRRGERFSLPNAYSNVPGITWRVVSRSSSGPAPLLSDVPHVEGDAAGERTDWYTFSADRPGTTVVELFGCYRCMNGGAGTGPGTPESAESRAYSETRTVKITVR